MGSPDQERVADLLRRARDHLRQGRHVPAGTLAEVILAWDPGNDDAMEMLARTAAHHADHARAAAMFAAAIVRRDTAQRQAALAHALTALDRHVEALVAFERAAELARDDYVIANDLGVALARGGRLAEAEAAFRRAVQLQPDMAAARGNLSTALRQRGLLDEAASFADPSDAAADTAEVQDHQAETLLQQGRFDEAVAVSRKVLARWTDDAALRHRHANRLQAAGYFAEAESELRGVIALLPDEPRPKADLGWVLRRQGRLAEAIEVLSAARERWPRDSFVMNSLAIVWQNAGRLDDALVLLEHAAEVAPMDAEVQHNLAVLLLRCGQYDAGWKAYEWRWQIAQGLPVRRGFAQPLWTGQPLNGATILLHAEQGFGDTLQFLRYVPMVAERGARVVLEVPASLGRLAASAAGIAELIWSGDPLPAFDLHCPLMSLPRAFTTTLETIPSAPYLSVPADAVTIWRERLARYSDLRVGLVWAGRSEHRDDTQRSLPFDALQQLWDLPGVDWFSLQLGPRAAELASAPRGRVTDLAPLLADFADTAAALHALDVLVTVDTATAHLAGALGRPAWVLLASACDWRWMHGRDDTPWYPSLRLIRQASLGQWNEVVTRAAGMLSQLQQGATMSA